MENVFLLLVLDHSHYKKIYERLMSKTEVARGYQWSAGKQIRHERS